MFMSSTDIAVFNVANCLRRFLAW